MTDVMVELRAANPAPAEAEPHPAAWSDTALLAEIDTRSGIDMSLDQKPRTERARAVEGPRRWSRWLVTTAAFAVVVGVIGVVALVDFGGTDTTEPPAATTAPPEVSTTLPPAITAAPSTLTAEQLSFVTLFFESWNDDIDTHLRLIAQDAVIQQVGNIKYDAAVESPASVERENFDKKARFEAAVDTRTTYEAEQCSTRGGLVICPFETTDILLEGKIGFATGRVHLDIVDDSAQYVLIEWVGGNHGGLIRELDRWLRANYPEAAGILGDRFSLETAAIWRQYVPRYLGQPAPLNASETELVTRLMNAWNTDTETYLGLFASGAVRGGVNDIALSNDNGAYREYTDEQFEAVHGWMRALGASMVVPTESCSILDSLVTCPFTYTDPAIERPFASHKGTLEIAFTDGVVSRLTTNWPSSAFNTGVFGPFRDWLNENHPEDRPKMMVNSGQPIYTEESGMLWRERLAEFYAG